MRYDSFTLDLHEALSPNFSTPVESETARTVSIAPVNFIEPRVERSLFTLDGVDLDIRGAKTKVAANLEAIRTLKAIERAGRAPRHEERVAMARYLGWGGLPQAFRNIVTGEVSEGWGEEVAALESLLTAEELTAARASTLDAFYTPPGIVRAIYDGLQAMGFTGARVLEPSCGVGAFIGLAPAALRDAAEWTTVELDSITSRIVSHLYPEARHFGGRAFQDLSLDPTFDLVIGNPPFGRTVVFDAANRDLRGFTIHNYFVARSVKLLRPGGILAMVVTRRFLDQGDSPALRWLSSRAELLGAIRLPNTAFAGAAGTNVTTDIVFLRRLADGSAAGTSIAAEPVEIADANGGAPIPVHPWFASHPETMLGRMARVHGQFAADEPVLLPDPARPFERELTTVVASLPLGRYEPASVEAGTRSEVPRDVPVVPAGLRPFHHFYDAHGRLYQVAGDMSAVPVRLDARYAPRMAALVSLRDAMRDLYAAESTNAPDADIDVARAALNVAYDRFVKRFGYVNAPVNVRLFREDADAYRLRALEVNYTRLEAAEAAAKGLPLPKGRKTLEMADKATIFSRRVVRAPKALHAETASDALAISLNVHGVVNVPFMAGLLGVSEDQLLAELRNAVFLDPETSEYVTRDEYLSGNVKAKLRAAERAAQRDPAFRHHVEALQAVQPADLAPVDIFVALGSPWVPESDYEQFAHDVIGLKGSITFSPSTQAFYCNVWGGHGTFATKRASAAHIFAKALNRHPIKITDEVDGQRVTNLAETDAANGVADAMREAFDAWVWKDAERRLRLARLYNDRFNTDVQRTYDGSHLTFPGKVEDDLITLRPNQVNSIWRQIQEGRLLVDQVVGSGKTYLAIAAVMEMRRMGLLAKPLFVVPNHLVEQWAQHFVRLYPAANILAVSKEDFSRDRRATFLARVATGDWDAVIIAHSQLQRISLPVHFEIAFINEQVAELQAGLALMKSADTHGLTVKRTEERIKALKEKVEALMKGSARDPGVPDMQEMGIDHLVVDEAHSFKNLPFSTSKQNVSGIGNPEGSLKAYDLLLKCRWLQRTRRGRGVVFLTGTPISNSLAEMFTMQRYLAPEELVARGIHLFDLWANTFAQESVEFELDASSRGLKARTVLKRFSNVPEMMAIYRRIADTLTLPQLKELHKAATGEDWPVPMIQGGKPENIVVPAGRELSNYIQHDIIPRMQAVCGELGERPDPSVDNMLRITNDARLAALDVRLRVPQAADDPDSKVNVALRHILAIHREWETKRGTQLVFCDLSTPSSARDAETRAILALVEAANAGDDDAQEKVSALSPDELLAAQCRFSVYDDLRAKLIAAGVDPREVAFIHDARTDCQKQALFDRVNRGDVRILIGSTSKMGAGTNVQRRLVALHHLDAPWRPSDLEQREGRILRQGNLFHELDPASFAVRILRYAVERTYDARMWQLIERKAAIVDQVRAADSSVREVDDVIGQAASAAEMKAAATGDPRIIEQVELDARVKRLRTMRRLHEQRRYDAESELARLRTMPTPEEEHAKAVARARAVSARLAGHPARPFAITVGGRVHTAYGTGVKELGAALAAAERASRRTGKRLIAATYRGVDLVVVASSGGTLVELMYRDAPELGLLGDFPWNEHTKLGGVIARCDHALAEVNDWIGSADRRLEAMRKHIADLEGIAAQQFRQADELEQLTARLAAVTKELIAASRRQTLGAARSPAAHDAASPPADTLDDDAVACATEAA